MTELCHGRVTLSSVKANEINVLQNSEISQHAQSLACESVGFEIPQKAGSRACKFIFCLVVYGVTDACSGLPVFPFQSTKKRGSDEHDDLGSGYRSDTLVGVSLGGCCSG
jgi:hypothetical protein